MITFKNTITVLLFILCTAAAYSQQPVQIPHCDVLKYFKLNLNPTYHIDLSEDLKEFIGVVRAESKVSNSAYYYVNVNYFYNNKPTQIGDIIENAIIETTFTDRNGHCKTFIMDTTNKNYAVEDCSKLKQL